MRHFESAMDLGGQSPSWIICTDVGGRSFLSSINYSQELKKDVVIWCANLDKARRFKTIGGLAEAFAIIPEAFEPYEEDPRFIDRHSL